MALLDPYRGPALALAGLLGLGGLHAQEPSLAQPPADLALAYRQAWAETDRVRDRVEAGRREELDRQRAAIRRERALEALVPALDKMVPLGIDPDGVARTQGVYAPPEPGTGGDPGLRRLTLTVPVAPDAPPWRLPPAPAPAPPDPLMDMDLAPPGLFWPAAATPVALMDDHAQAAAIPEPPAGAPAVTPWPVRVERQDRPRTFEYPSPFVRRRDPAPASGAVPASSAKKAAVAPAAPAAPPQALRARPVSPAKPPVLSAAVRANPGLAAPVAASLLSRESPLGVVPPLIPPAARAAENRRAEEAYEAWLKRPASGQGSFSEVVVARADE